jgi:hypothetical protein
MRLVCHAQKLAGRAGLLKRRFKDFTTPYPFRIKHIQGKNKVNAMNNQGVCMYVETGSESRVIPVV